MALARPHGQAFGLELGVGGHGQNVRAEDNATWPEPRYVDLDLWKEANILALAKDRMSGRGQGMTAKLFFGLNTKAVAKSLLTLLVILNSSYHHTYILHIV